jgi:hypothetical protein
MLGLLHVGQQVVLYGVIFGAPLLLGICMTIGAGVKRLALPTLVVIGATLMALPALWGILAQAHSSDSPRIIGGTSVTYGFITSSAADWLESLPWIRPSPSTEFRSTFAHEINYPVGPLLILLVLLPFRRAWSIVIALAVSAVAVVAFSMDLAPVSRALLSVVPPLNLFRVPARAALVWLWVLPIVGVAAALHREGTQPPGLSRWKTLAPWLAIPLGSVLLLLPAAAREIVAAALIVIVVVQTRWHRNGVPVAVGLVVLGLLSVASFADRLFTFYDLRSLFATADRIGVAVRAANPALASALTRVHLAFEIRPFAANTAFVAGLSTLDGYAVPTRRFSTLVSALRGERYEPTANFFRFTPGDAALTPLRQIYNVTHTVALPEPRSLVITPLGPTAGAAWFSAKSVRADNVSALAKDLRAPGDALHAAVREILWFDTSDPLTVSAPSPRDVDGRCGEARVTAVTASRHRQEITADVATAVKCPLTFATNFTEDLTAVAELESGVQLVVPVFPGYGALASVVVPAAARRITLLAQPVRLPWALMWVVAGVTCCTGAAWLITSGNAGAELAGDTRCGRATQSA